MAAQSAPVLRGTLRLNEPMAAHCSWRAGGAAARCYRPADLDDLGAFLASLPAGEPLLWVGLGSNLLVRDGGFAGTVVSVAGRLDAWRFTSDTTLEAQAGVACAKLAREAARRGCTGAEFFAGIPGSLGGALAMNAGAFGGETWSIVTAVETIDRKGRLRSRTAADYGIGYRTVTGPQEEWFVAATLALGRDVDGAAAQRIRALLAQRQASQPIGQPSCGSVFRNPYGDYAARLIEACGLKGYRLGGCQVSTKHANFIVNDGGASATDIEALINAVREAVRSRFGVDLEPEVRIVGERQP
ncbi:MAG: UDP-N-acetylmuramate dehydrogenase [Gammaproteobacteria bacterium]|nr:UDP-N-acetylmuramate dehydrogenase [Gammaproteobacteria bacterium]